MSQTISGSFPEGIIHAGGVHTEFILSEQTFRTTLEIAHDPDIDRDLMNDEVYYSAAMMSKRLKVAGIAKLTPEMVLDLSALDSQELADKTMKLETQRSNFRDAAQAAAQEGAGAP